MKNCTPELAAELARSSEFVCCDLFKWVLSNGVTYYIADFDKDVVYLNHVYKHDGVLMERGQTKTTGEPTVDTLTVTVRADHEHGDTIGGEYVLKAAHSGILDDSYITLTRAYFDKDTGVLLGGIEVFSGRCDVSSCGGIQCVLTCASECTGLNATLPPRCFAPQNVYEETSGGVVSSSTDAKTCMIPLKPSKNVLVRI